MEGWREGYFSRGKRSGAGTERDHIRVSGRGGNGWMGEGGTVLCSGVLHPAIGQGRHDAALHRACDDIEAKGSNTPHHRRFERRPGLPKGRTGGTIVGGSGGMGNAMRYAQLHNAAAAPCSGTMDVEATPHGGRGGKVLGLIEGGLLLTSRERSK